MSVPQNGPKPNVPAPPNASPTHRRPVSHRHRRHTMPCLADWDFWRFLLAALGLVWEVLKTTLFK